MLSAGDCPASVTGEEAEHARRRSETRKSQKQSVLGPSLRCSDRSELFKQIFQCIIGMKMIELQLQLYGLRHRMALKVVREACSFQPVPLHNLSYR